MGYLGSRKPYLCGSAVLRFEEFLLKLSASRRSTQVGAEGLSVRKLAQFLHNNII